MKPANFTAKVYEIKTACKGRVEVTHSHLVEALAASLGFQTHRAMLAAEPGAVQPFSEQRFIERLTQLTGNATTAQTVADIAAGL